MRQCADCQVDISHRGHSSFRCVDCQSLEKLRYQAEYRAKHARTEETRRYKREWMRNRRAEIRADPERHAKHLANRRRRERQKMADPQYRVARAKAKRECQDRLLADPAKAAAHRARNNDRNRSRYWNDPEHRRRHLDRTTKIRKNIPALIRRDGNKCGICGRNLPRNPTERTVDHIVPKIFGGTDSLHNLRMACGSCNKSRGARMAHGDQYALDI